MAVLYWTGRAGVVSQIETITVGGTIAINDTFTVTIGNASVTFTATAATIANVTAGLVAAMTAGNAPPQFEHMTWEDSNPTIVGTGAGAADSEGRPVTVTVSKSSVSGTISTSTTRTPTGPHHADDVNNYSGGALPVNGDTVYFHAGGSAIKYGLDALNAVTTLTLDFDSHWTHQVGLPTKNELGFTEYLDKSLQVSGATKVNIRGGDGQSSPMLRFDFGSAVFTLEAEKTGSGINGMPAVLIDSGSHADSVVECREGASVGIGMDGEDTVTVKTITQSGGLIECGPQVTLNGTGSTITVKGGEFRCRTAILSLDLSGGGTAIVNGSANSTTVTVAPDSTLELNSSGTVTTLTNEGTLDMTNDASSRTISTLNVKAGSTNTGLRNATITTLSIDSAVDEMVLL